MYWYLTAIRRGTEFGQVQLRPTALGTAPNEHTHSATELAYLRAPTGSTLAVVVSKDDSSAGNIAQVTCTIGGDNIRLKS